MPGPKLNEATLVAGERSGTRSTAKYTRSSAYKAREVLDLIRGLPVRRADEVLQFVERDVARTVRKVLASAVANAIHNDEQDADELFVKACFADEGPTLRRFRPRARGRASRIRKRTSHITVIVARMSDEQLAVLQAKADASMASGRGRAASAAAARRARVEASRKRAAARRGGAAEAGATEEVEEIEDEITDTEVVDELATDEIEDTIGEVDTDEAETEETEAGDEAEAADETVDAEAPDADDETEEKSN